ncbi:MAG: ABC transporter ATP-binding protein [Clostridia bacterium]|nr:ABC transporter ATP-binding protein [Clostridia bacterium]
MVCKDIYKSYGEKEVLRGFSHAFEPGSVTAVTGPSGCGKTTLVSIVAGLVIPDSGSVENAPQNISAVFQEDRLIDGHDVRANIRFACGNIAPERVAETLDALGLEDEYRTDVSSLSGGMRRRVAIARALLAPYDLLILDEPFKGLDETLKAKVASYVACCAKGKTVIFITHDISELDFFENCRNLELGHNPQTEYNGARKGIPCVVLFIFQTTVSCSAAFSLCSSRGFSPICGTRV